MLQKRGRQTPQKAYCSDSPSPAGCIVLHSCHLLLAAAFPRFAGMCALDVIVSKIGLPLIGSASEPRRTPTSNTIILSFDKPSTIRTHTKNGTSNFNMLLVHHPVHVEHTSLPRGALLHNEIIDFHIYQHSPVFGLT